jgi:hypothetical protein
LVWINADILPGPGEELNDSHAQSKMTPKFNASKFLETVTQQLAGTTLSIGWTTSLANKRAPYTKSMVDEMLEFLKPYQDMHVTFPIRATSFRNSWEVLQPLYRNSWTVTIWWSLDKLEEEELEWIYATLEEGEELLKDRTYYDIVGLRRRDY